MLNLSILRREDVLLVFIYVHVSVSLCECLCRYTQRTEEDVISPGDGVTGSWELPAVG